MGRPLVFALNGERVEVAQPDPAMNLLTYIRKFTPYKGTKLGCGEGGCGACVVLLARYDAGSKRVEESTINSCLAPLCSLDLCSIVTTEGLGNSRDGLHAVHKRLAGFHASQCGFCTPGMTMALYGAVKRSQGNGDGCGLTAVEAEKAVQGHICRCTGYRPILDACKSFAKDVDLEDLGLNTFWSKGENASSSLLPAYNPASDPAVPQFLLEIAEKEQSPEWSGTEFLDSGIAERQWIPVRSLEDLFAALNKYRGQQKEVKLVVGNTSQGIYKDVRPQVFIDISSIPELLTLRHGKGGLEVGSAVSISKFISFLEESHSSTVYAQLAVHLHRVASVHVRNRASVGGNLIMAQQLGFDSDVATILLGAGALLKLASSSGEVVLSMEEFLERGALEPGEVLVSVVVPAWELGATSSNGTGVVKANGNGSAEPSSREQLLFKTYRASPRRLGNAVSYVNAAFLARVERVGEKHSVTQARLAFGAFGSKHAVLASEVQDFLVGKELSAEVLLEAITLLRSSVVPSRGTHKAPYRASVVVAYLFDFFRSFLEQTNTLKVNHEISESPVHVNGLGGVVSKSPSERGTSSLSNGGTKPRAQLLSGGTQRFATSEEFYPVGQSAPKVMAELQASGEAVYVDDIPSPEGCLYAAFVCSEHALAELKGIDASSALASPGAVSLVTADDIPKGGQNCGISMMGIVETLFATEKVEFHGHPVALMVADSDQHARDAAAKVDVRYDTEKLGAPILSIEDAIARDSYLPLPPFVTGASSPIGDAAKAMSEAEEKIEDAEVFCGSQYHFYMEAQTALAIPDEDGQLVVYSASQGTEGVQGTIAQCLGIPHNSVRVITRRLGGGFGGKATKSCIIATACALAAWKLRQPVRMYLDRKTDMLIAGGRNPTKAIYSVGFTKEGKVTALQAKVFVNSGWSSDASVYIPMFIHKTLKKYDWGAFSAEYKVVKTNQSSKTTVRAPGDVKGAFIAEAIIEHVATVLGLTAHEVREKNMHSLESATSSWGRTAVGGPEGFTLPLIWEQLKNSSKFQEREREINSYNKTSQWLKRGLAMVPAVYTVFLSGKLGRVTAFADGSVVAEVGGIEMGQGLWTKVIQSVAYGLGQLWEKPGTGGVDIAKVRVVQADSISFGHGGYTGGSTTSEGNCAAVVEACKMLVDRLKPIKEKLEAASPEGVTWEAIVGTAKMTGVDLSAQTSWNVEPTATHYCTFGASVSEVEVDVLTGETTILRSDLIYDCGKSMNPAVDIGQVEGAFIYGVGLFLTEEILIDSEGHQLSEGTWLYKPPTIDNIPRVFNVELLNSTAHKDRILSSKACGEPPLLLAASVHCAVREAINAAREDIKGDRTGFLRLDAPASIDKVKTNCGLDNVELYLSALAGQKKPTTQSVTS